MFIKCENNVEKIRSLLNACSNNNWRGAQMRNEGEALAARIPRGYELIGVTLDPVLIR